MTSDNKVKLNPLTKKKKPKRKTLQITSNPLHVVIPFPVKESIRSFAVLLDCRSQDVLDFILKNAITCYDQNKDLLWKHYQKYREDWINGEQS